MQYIYYANVVDIVKFLLGHTPFAKHLSYAPVREFNRNGDRIYTEAHTADMWWDIQRDYLGADATLVPIHWFSDKTHLTASHGDKHNHPVYITILNLSHGVRRQPSRPSTILLGLIPILPKKTPREYRIRSFHKAMEVMFKRNKSISNHYIQLH